MINFVFLFFVIVTANKLIYNKLVFLNEFFKFIPDTFSLFDLIYNLFDENINIEIILAYEALLISVFEAEKLLGYTVLGIVILGSLFIERFLSISETRNSFFSNFNIINDIFNSTILNTGHFVDKPTR